MAATVTCGLLFDGRAMAGGSGMPWEGPLQHDPRQPGWDLPVAGALIEPVTMSGMPRDYAIPHGTSGLSSRGPDLESASESDLMAVRARLNNALKRLGTGWCLHGEARRRAALSPRRPG